MKTLAKLSAALSAGTKIRAKRQFGIVVGAYAFAVSASALCASARDPQIAPDAPIVAKPVSGKLDYKIDDFRNYLGLWCGGACDNLRFARNMAIRHVLYNNGMEKLPESKGMFFYLPDPEYVGVYRRMIDFNNASAYSQKEIDHLRDFCAMKDASLPFPDCMATGWFVRFHHREWSEDHKQYGVCSLIPNMQKQKVIDAIVQKNKERALAIEKSNPDFKFAGFVWDVPQLEGDFWGEISDKRGGKRYVQCGLSHWRGADSADFPKGEKPDYPTYCEGRVAFYRTIRAAFDGHNPKIKLVVDPYQLWGNYAADFVRLGISPDDPAIADYVQVEHGTDKHFKIAEAWNTGYFKVENFANACDIFVFDFLKEIHAVGAAASLGAWSVWFGNPCPSLPSIRDVPARMKLTRAIASWENLNNTPIDRRKWDAENLVYSSPTAHMSRNVIWAIHPETKKLFFCFLNPDASLTLPDGMKIREIHPLTSIFDEYLRPRVTKNFIIKNGVMSISPDHKYTVGDAYVAY